MREAKHTYAGLTISVYKYACASPQEDKLQFLRSMMARKRVRVACSCAGTIEGTQWEDLYDQCRAASGPRFHHSCFAAAECRKWRGPVIGRS